MLILIIFKPKKVENFAHCSTNNNKENCENDQYCRWDSSAMGCSDLDCSIINNDLDCITYQKCRWDSSANVCVYKETIPSVNSCTNKLRPECYNPTCEWNNYYNRCEENNDQSTQIPTTFSELNEVNDNLLKIPSAELGDPTGKVSDISRDNDFFIKNNNTDNVIMELDNINSYYLESDPIVIGKKFKMIKFLNNSELRIYREDSDSEKDFTFGFYFKTFETQIPKVFESFLELTNSDGSFQLNANLDMVNNKIVFVFSTKNISNTVQLSFNNSKILNYVIIQIENDINNNVPKIIFNLNNQITIFKFMTNNKIKVNNISFKNFEGYVGKVLVYNSIIEKEKLCRKFNCKLSCFRPDGTKTYGGNVNKCIKDCMKSCDNISKCQQICVDCEIEEEEWDNKTKLKMCPWLKDIKIFDKSPPDPPKIRGFPGDGKILIEWRKPFNGRGTINNYIIMVYETFNKKNGVQINIASNPTCDLCEHEIKNLKNQVYYDIIVKAVNNIGIGSSSNIITIAPNGEKLKNDLNNIFYELDTDLNKSISSEDIDMDCSKKTFNNIQNHSLDKNVPNLENFIRKN